MAKLIEILYGEPIAEFVEHILAFAARDGLRYDLLHGHYADGWETVTAFKARWSYHLPRYSPHTHWAGASGPIV